jgi:hypothetical protein
MNLFENAILFINELIKIRNQQNNVLLSLDKNKESTAILFKIKNYKKWIENMNLHILNKTIIKNKADIIKLNFTDKLSYHLIELFEKGNITEINNAREELEKLDSSKINLTTIDNTIDNTISNASRILDTTKIESQPKILNGEVRPNDLRGGSIFDLRYVHGIGQVNATKLVDSGVTLEGLLSEWKEYTLKDKSNSILMSSKMPIPNQYSKTQWDSLDKDKKYSILEINLKKKLSIETKQLCKLHKSSLVGIKYFNDMSLKIPREEIQKAESILKKIALHMNKDLLVMICGSYRRGKDKSGDVDCLIAHPLIKTKLDLDNSQDNLLENFVTLLINSKFIVDQLDMGTKKFMGFCDIMQFIKSKSKSELQTLPSQSVARRIDIRFVPFESYGSSILYFTGSRKFNTDMRTHALRKGYSLSEFGLKNIKDGTTIACSTEEEIFKILNYPYKKPEERDI